MVSSKVTVPVERSEIPSIGEKVTVLVVVGEEQDIRKTESREAVKR